MEFARIEFQRSDDPGIEPLPNPTLGYLWQWFCDLCDWRDCGMGIGPLSHCEMEAWARLIRLEIFPSEVEALRGIDRVFRAHHNEKNKEPEPEPAQSLVASLAKLKSQERKPASKKKK